MDCPRIVSVDETKDLRYEERLDVVKKVAQSLYEFCLEKNLTNQQIKTCLTPFLRNQTSIYKRLMSGSARSILWISFFVLLVAVVIKWYPAFWFAHAQLRFVQLKILPFWDWSQLYDQDCILDNPFLITDKNYTEEDCKGCIDLLRDMKPPGGDIDRYQNVNTTFLTDEYLAANRPVVITDPIRDWPVDGNQLKLNFDSVKKLYITHENLVEGSGLESCEFHSTMEDVRTLYEFLKLLDKEALPEMYHVAWDNCEVKAAKVFRLYTKRPYFIPAMAELSRSNQFVLANGNFSGHKFRIPQQADSATWMIVLRGQIEITLSPDIKCEQLGCDEEVHFTVLEGEAVLVPTSLWLIQYSPISSGLTFAFASSVIWDDVM